MAHSKDDLTKIVIDIISAESRYPESKLELTKSLTNELDIDSISMMTIFIKTEEQTKIKIPDEIWANLTTIELLVEYLIAQEQGEING
jgi:acyl carrier protein